MSKIDTQQNAHPSGPGNAGPGTTGHEWDGIQELNNPLPRWWLWIFYATIVFAAVWVVLYPAIPLPGGNTQGTLGYSSRADVEQQMQALDAQRDAALKGIEAIAIEDLGKDPKLLQAAIEGGRSAFKVHCVQCHGSGAAGSTGYPNLNDDDWMWGGDYASIYRTIQHGIRQPGDDETHQSVMPAFGKDGLLQPAEIASVTEYVLAISGQEHDRALAARGAPVFEQQCASCHGADGKGMREFGSPNLTDAIWLYGGDRASIHNTVFYAHAGVMPSWKGRLSDATIRKLTAYVHSLGGGE
ncbi:cytochrome-c oxidase, cbb3-type subunit III [Sandaracinobacter sp. RS1-74]|uniref:cytochrome-c oxidase, cbb3-type subunit III n=1 Tax=Sandaracinobacteroides sayramensis TaxID=2913411 RepID=UPI001EDA2134|nr:cytochrome-c oxidase, cbb3-type subunit III [Sandaracinobacteroides sayramensis]MCG2841448.1 cytochrome-c oxidase, cbb3-type subunit III [Sandaracinobacteroides sayramensis]